MTRGESSHRGARIIAGAMSGTSADGVDVALTRIEGRGLETSACVIHHHQRTYPAELRRRIFRIREEGKGTLRELSELAREIALVYAAAVNEAMVYARLEAKQVSCIAAHGQTLFHDPPMTMQWIDPALLAAETGCAVISDFRRADCAAEGQGAPLVPFADYVLFRHREKNRALVNIGGIANVTLLPAGCSLDEVVAFDTGPGNCVSDWICREESIGQGYDAGGERALRGRVDEHVVQEALADAYFSRKPPKSTDGPEMIEVFRRAVGGKRMSVEDRLATACEITAQALIGAMGAVDQVVLSGGGGMNRRIVEGLRKGMKAELLSTDDLGIKSEAKEALAFALLGAATLDGLPGNVKSVTGARRGVVLGSITPVP